jgi:hypothetical protein
VYIPPKEQTTTEEETNMNRNSHPTVVNKRQTPSIQKNLTRSTQPLFSVSAIFAVRYGGGGCGSCGH